MRRVSRNLKWLLLLALLPRSEWAALAGEMRRRTRRVWIWDDVLAPRLLGA